MVTETQVGTLLTVASGFDRREVDAITARSWYLALSKFECSYEEIEQIIIDHAVGPKRHEYLQIGHIVDALTANARTSAYAVEADVRSAKARGIVPRDWPDKLPLPPGHAESLRLARARDAAEAEAALVIESPVDYA